MITLGIFQNAPLFVRILKESHIDDVIAGFEELLNSRFLAFLVIPAYRFEFVSDEQQY